MLHETAVAWVRYKLAQTVPARAWEEPVDAYRARLKDAVAAINREYDVEGLCRGLPARLDSLIKLKGGRLKK